MKSRVFIFPTLACNLRCPECYQRESAHKPRAEMTLAAWRRIVALLLADGTRVDECVFTGGEPTLWPYLAGATLDAHGFSRKVRVISNGHKAEPASYGPADVVQLSDYGGINALDLLRLRRALGGRRVKVQEPVHFPCTWRRYPPSESSPGVCGCAGWSFVGEPCRVYPCAVAAGVQAGPSVGLEESFERVLVDDPRRSELCFSCPVNRRNRGRYMPERRYVKVGIWEGPGWLIPVPRVASAAWRAMRGLI